MQIFSINNLILEYTEKNKFFKLRKSTIITDENIR